MRLGAVEGLEGRLAYAIAGFLFLAGPLWHVLYTGRYPFTRPEAVALPVACGLVGVAIALLARAMGRHLGSVVFGGLLFAFADLQFNPQEWTYTAVVVASCVALAWLLWRHRAMISVLALGAFYLTSLDRVPVARPTGIAGEAVGRESNPMIVHLILDEQAGVGGLRAAGDTATADFLRRFYAERGFELYEGAYSRYRSTDESIPAALSLGTTPSVEWSERWRGGPRWRRMRSIPYFRTLRERGYDVRVFANTFLDYCSAADSPVQTCAIDEANTVRNFGTLEGETHTRATWVARYILNTRSHVYRKLRRDPDAWRHAVAGGGLETARRVIDAIDAGPRGGTAYFAHILTPHQPADVDAECRLLDDPDDRVNYPDSLDDTRRREALRIVGGQVRCVHTAVAAILAAVDRRAGRDGAIVIVHGDHGNRLDRTGLDRPPISTYERDGLNAGYATLFAIRRPRHAGGVHAHAVPAQDLLWAYVRENFGDVESTQWVHAIRRLPARRGDADTLRLLSAADMPWARAP